MGFRLPAAHEESKVHDPQASPACFGPPSGFGYPLDGLRPSSPCRFCFTPAALMGFALRSLASRKVTARYRAIGPTYRSPDRSSRRRSDKPELPGRGFWVFTLPGVPVPVGRYLTCRHAGCSLGLRPFRVRSRQPAPGVRPGLLSHAWRVPRLPGVAPASQSLDQPPPGSGSPRASTKTSRTTLVGFSHRCKPDSFGPAVVRAMSSPSAASGITADRRTV